VPLGLVAPVRAKELCVLEHTPPDPAQEVDRDLAVLLGLAPPRKHIRRAVLPVALPARPPPPRRPLHPRHARRARAHLMLGAVVCGGFRDGITGVLQVKLGGEFEE
jgi:hypothetical protein